MKSTLLRLPLFLLVFISFFATNQLIAHSPDQSYLYLRIYKESIEGRYELTAKDMNKAMGLGLPVELSLELVKPHLTTIYNYIKSRSNLKAGGKTFNIKFTEPTLLALKDEQDYIRFNFELEGIEEVPDELDIYYNLLFDRDDKHKGMLIIEYNWKAGIVDNEALFSNVYSKDDTQQSLSLKDASVLKGFIALVKLGVWHIWIGLDHILFIFALILPSVVRRRNKDVPLSLSTLHDSWEPVDKFKPAFMYIVKIITFFTIAHSITLALASLKIINMPSWFVESIIALSIALAAFHNIKPILKSKEWLIAFGFGLFHGFGFASVLGEKGLGGDYLVLSLLGFNIGVELGQLLIICMIFPFLFLLRRQKLYPFIIKYGSIVLIFISIYWFIERAFDVDLPLGAYFWKIFDFAN
jgi:hypothetical protein